MKNRCDCSICFLYIKQYYKINDNALCITRAEREKWIRLKSRCNHTICFFSCIEEKRIPQYPLSNNLLRYVKPGITEHE